MSTQFEGLSRIQSQRKVFALLADEMGPEIHALSMKTFTPEQWQDE